MKNTKLFSISQELSKGAQISNDIHKNLVLIYPDGDFIVFKRRQRTKNGWIGGINMEVVSNKVSNFISDEVSKSALEKNLSKY